MTKTKTSTVDVSSFYTYSEDNVLITDISSQLLTYRIVEENNGSYRPILASLTVKIDISNLGVLSYKVSKSEST